MASLLGQTIITIAVDLSSHPHPIWQMLCTSRSVLDVTCWQRPHSNLNFPSGYEVNRAGQSRREFSLQCGHMTIVKYKWP